MSFFEKHFEYIESCAKVRAIEIANATGCFDIDDFKQQLLLRLYLQIPNYRKEKSSPHTFINLIMVSAKRMILRSMRTNKYKILSTAQEIKHG